MGNSDEITYKRLLNIENSRIDRGSLAYGFRACFLCTLYVSQSARIKEGWNMVVVGLFKFALVSAGA
jgi:hypothetical protein